MKIITTKIHTLILLCICLVTTLNLYSQEQEYLTKDRSYLDGQNSTEVKKESAALDESILQINDRIKRYSRLKNIKIKYMPRHTLFTVPENKAYIEIEEYSFIPVRDKFSILEGGMQSQLFRLHFNGDTLSKVETVVTSINYNQLRIKEITIIDPSPATKNTDDISVEQYESSLDIDDASFQDIVPRKFTLADYQNTVFRPKKNQFKKAFYILNLRRIDHLFERAEEFQITHTDKVKDKVLKHLEETLEVTDPRKTKIE